MIYEIGCYSNDNDLSKPTDQQSASNAPGVAASIISGSPQTLKATEGVAIRFLCLCVRVLISDFACKHRFFPVRRRINAVLLSQAFRRIDPRTLRLLLRQGGTTAITSFQSLDAASSCTWGRYEFQIDQRQLQQGFLPKIMHRGEYPVRRFSAFMPIWAGSVGAAEHIRLVIVQNNAIWEFQIVKLLHFYWSCIHHHQS